MDDVIIDKREPPRDDERPSRRPRFFSVASRDPETGRAQIVEERHLRLPQILVDEKVDDRLQVSIGNRKASFGPAVLCDLAVNEWEE